MKLTTYTDYAFRTLIFLALHRETGSTIQALADSYGISRNHLMKVVQQLGQLGYVETTRGRGGGIRLGMAPQDIRLGDVVRKTEEDMDIVECFNPADDRCTISRACRPGPSFAPCSRRSSWPRTAPRRVPSVATSSG